MSADQFLTQLNPPIQSTSSAPAQEPEPIGASVRWAVGIDEQNEPRLELQGLPSAAKYLTKKFFTNDNSVSVLLGSYPLQADMFSGSFAKGLVPIFFSSSRAAAQQFLQANPNKAKETIQAVNQRFLHMEHLILEEAAAYLKAKKLRAPKGIPAFPSQLPKKRARPPAQDLTESGTRPYTINIFHIMPYSKCTYICNIV